MLQPFLIFTTFSTNPFLFNLTFPSKALFSLNVWIRRLKCFQKKKEFYLILVLVSLKCKIHSCKNLSGSVHARGEYWSHVNGGIREMECLFSLNDTQ